MHLIHAALLLTTLLPCITNSAPIVSDVQTVDVKNKYIVTLKSGADVSSHISWVTGIHARRLESRGNSVNSTTGIQKQYQIADFKAYTGSFDPVTIEEIKQNPDVAAVEADQIWQLDALTFQNPSTWGLGRISHRTAGIFTYPYDTTAGSGTFGYVVDGGVNTAHIDFGGRASLGYNAVGGPFVDSVGHGTHVAGIIASKTFGVAKKAQIIAIKVFHGNTSATSIILDGYQWAVNDIVFKGRQNKAVINLSLGGFFSAASNSAVNSAFASGITTVVAAGNSNVDASGFSPASAPGAITVGAIQFGDIRASYSNFGSVLDVFAPGTNILSLGIGSTTALKRMTGTSMAAPHVAGLVLYLQAKKEISSPAAVMSKIVALATTGKVIGAGIGSPNRIAYNGGVMV